jgi:hypothetical protein
MPAEQLLFAEKKAYLESYIALYRHTNAFFEKKLEELNVATIHSNATQKIDLLFYFVHYSCIRGMKSCLMEFNTKGNVEESKLFQLYDRHRHPIEPYMLIEAPQILSYALTETFFKKLNHTAPLTQESYAKARGNFIPTFQKLRRQASYQELLSNLKTHREQLLKASQSIESSRWRLVYASITLLVLLTIATVALLYMYVGIQAAMLGGAAVLALSLFWKPNLSELCKPLGSVHLTN